MPGIFWRARATRAPLGGALAAEGFPVACNSAGRRAEAADALPSAPVRCPYSRRFALSCIAWGPPYAQEFMVVISRDHRLVDSGRLQGGYGFATGRMTPKN